MIQDEMDMLSEGDVIVRVMEDDPSSYVVRRVRSICRNSDGRVVYVRTDVLKACGRYNHTFLRETLGKSNLSLYELRESSIVRVSSLDYMASDELSDEDKEVIYAALQEG